ncbi:MAG: hypothetical protein NTW46_03820 [Candidatus Nealsonbacteria bacterium]|nr:hypothetical protein [Candidatus Nealsonbacteria bacterium]
MNEKTKTKLQKLFIGTLREIKEELQLKNDKENITMEKYKAIPKERLAKLSKKEKRDYLVLQDKFCKRTTELIAQALKQGLEEEMKTQNKPSKLVYYPEKERQESLRKMNEHSKNHPEAFFWYLFQTGQITDLTKDDFVKINEYVRQRKKEEPYCDMWEISEEEVLKYLQAQKK